MEEHFRRVCDSVSLALPAGTDGIPAPQGPGSRAHPPADLRVGEALHEVLAHAPGAPSALRLLVVVGVVGLALRGRGPLGLPLGLGVGVAVIGLSLKWQRHTVTRARCQRPKDHGQPGPVLWTRNWPSYQTSPFFFGK